MITKLTIRNFKVFEHAEIELGERVVFIGPNNSGKTSALQALALWNIGAKRWVEKRGAGNVPEKRPGVTINRRDLIAVPVPSAAFLWKDLHVRESGKTQGVKNVRIEVQVDGVSAGEQWTCGLEFDYANEESFYCRSIKSPDGGRLKVPAHAAELKIVYLPPMSGLLANETRLEEGAINVRLGEGRTAEVLRNLCFQVLQSPNGYAKWDSLVAKMTELFGIRLNTPIYLKERSEIQLSYRTPSGVKLDISSSGRGQQQTLLLLAHMKANPGSILLLDEPDAHLEILRQRQIYRVLTETAAANSSQIIAASHSEVILNEAADRDMVVAFVGKPHRIDDRGSQVVKSLKEIGFEHYYQAEEVGWVLYLEGSTDLAILKALAERLNHPAKTLLDRPYVHYVGNQPTKAQSHFHGLREAKHDLVGIAIFDRLEKAPPSDEWLSMTMWKRREIENYLCTKETLIAFAIAQCKNYYDEGELFAASWRDAMLQSITELEQALSTLGRQSPWSADTKVTDEFLDRLFETFYKKLNLPNLMRKTDYHALAAFVTAKDLDAEISEKLDLIAQVAAKATKRNAPH